MTAPYQMVAEHWGRGEGGRNWALEAWYEETLAGTVGDDGSQCVPHVKKCRFVHLLVLRFYLLILIEI